MIPSGRDWHVKANLSIRITKLQISHRVSLSLSFHEIPSALNCATLEANEGGNFGGQFNPSES